MLWNDRLFQDPPRDVPLGMFTSIGVCSLFNLIAVFISGATMLRDASGHVEPGFNNTTQRWVEFDCKLNNTCKYGLMNYFQVSSVFQYLAVASEQILHYFINNLFQHNENFLFFYTREAL